MGLGSAAKLRKVHVAANLKGDQNGGGQTPGQCWPVRSYDINDLSDFLSSLSKDRSWGHYVADRLSYGSNAYL